MEKAPLTLGDIQEVEEMLECGMQDEAEQRIIALAQKLEKDSVYSQVGLLTRDLHDAITRFADDERLRVITNVEIPDASERLRYIIDMTDKAANSTLDAVESCEPIVNSLLATIDNLMPAWDQLMHGQIDRFEFVNLCHKIDNLIRKTRDIAEKVSDQLNKIMMAQDYQDLTGQMIQKVIKLVAEVEDKLVKFLKSCGAGAVDTSKNIKSGTGIEAEGPALSKHKDSKQVAQSQDDVDDLLASLGF